MIKWIRRRIESEKGSALVAALAAMIILDTFAVAVMALTTSTLTRTASDRRSTQALNAADAGMNAAIWKITNQSGYAPTVEVPDTGTVADGQYEVIMENVAGVPNLRKLTVTAYSPSKTAVNPGPRIRKITATVQVAPRVLSYGMYAFSWIDIQGATARTYLAPIDYRGANAKGGDFGSNYTIYFNDAGIHLNDRGNQAGEQATYDALFGNPPVPMGDIVTAGTQGKVWAVNDYVNTMAELRVKCDKIFMNEIVHLSKTIAFPTLDFDSSDPYSFKSLAAANTANGLKNSTNGNGVYDTWADFWTKVFNGGSEKNPTITGMIWVNGEVDIPNNYNLTIQDGGLVIKDPNPTNGAPALLVANRASLRVLHGTSESKKYPGMAVYTTAGSQAQSTDNGTMEIEGLVYSERTYSEANSSVRIKGVLLASGVQSDASIVNKNASVIIQYDPAVIDMYGIMQTGDLFVSKVFNWRELPIQ